MFKFIEKRPFLSGLTGFVGVGIVPKNIKKALLKSKITVI